MINGKRITAALLSAAMLIASLCGCATENTGSSIPDSDVSSVTEITSSDDQDDESTSDETGITSDSESTADGNETSDTSTASGTLNPDGDNTSANTTTSAQAVTTTEKLTSAAVSTTTAPAEITITTKPVTTTKKPATVITTAQTAATQTTTTKKPSVTTTEKQTTTTKKPSVTTTEKQTTTTKKQTTSVSTGKTEPTTTTKKQTSTTKAPSSDAPVRVGNGFYISGTKLMDANGNQFVMRGINHAHTWYKDKLDVSLSGIAATGANTVRIVLSNGTQYSYDDVNSVKQIVEKCKQHKLVAILEVHDATGKNDVNSLNQAVDYWIGIKDALIGNEKYALLNIANEWYGSWDNLSVWANAYKEAIPKLRKAGINNTIIVDSAGWGQCYNSILSYATQIYAADPNANTMFSIHMYGAAGKNAVTIKKIIKKSIDLGFCLIVGEFGYNHSDGDVDEATILSYCTQTGTGYLGWSWKGNSGGVEYLDIAYDWEGKSLSPDWGEVLINGKNGIKQTSEICSVFK